MHPISRTILFGAIAGLIWSTAPGYIMSAYQSNPGIITVSSAASGIIVSVILAPLLINSKLTKCILLGIISLPLGAFTLGTTSEILFTTTSGSISLKAPWSTGFELALWSLLTPYTALLLPLAILTTLILKQTISNPPTPDAT